MPDELNPNDPRDLWQSQEDEAMTITIDEMRRRAAWLERRIRWRNAREYGAAAVVFIMLALQAPRNHGWRLTPLVLITLGVVYVVIQLHRRGARQMPYDAAMRTSLEFYRDELERQRDALHSVWRWYLLPMVPGLLAVMVIRGIDHGIDRWLIWFVIGFVLIFAGTWALNEWGARKLGRQIRELDSTQTGDR
jgi:hypothetical protein